MTEKSEALHAGAFVQSEANGTRSRDSGTLITGQNLGAGTVLGKITVAGATSAVKASGANTGGGTCTVDVTTPVLAKAKAGIYTVRCVGLVGNSGVFAVYRPDGSYVGTAYAGVAFDKEIKFVLADSGTDFAIGDGFDITVAVGSLKYTILAPAALDGSAAAAALLFDAVDATAADKKVTLMTRSCEINSNEVTWPAAISDPNKAIATAELAAAGIILR
jgi:hypothetical protein